MHPALSFLKRHRPLHVSEAFARLESAAHDAATSPFSRNQPTAAQREASDYAMGQIELHGLRLRIESPRNTYREKVGKGGKAWRSRMAAHYGDIEGTRGNDGDPIDVFVGPFPESTAVWVVNQRRLGTDELDEHKVMLGFVSASQARAAYLDSYDRDWKGLMGLVQASVSQLKWWLQFGDKGRPFSADQLPFEGLQTMEKVLWNQHAEPTTKPLHRLMYDLRLDDAKDGLLLDAVTMDELMTDPDIESTVTFDALVVEVGRMQQKMDLLKGVMTAAGGAVKPTEVTISDPVKSRGVLQVMVLFQMSDGQTVSVWFHNPDTTPAKLMPLDELISWKWMLNKKDVTIVVAPEKGRDLNVREVARRIMRLVERNSEAYQKANAKAVSRAAESKALDEEITALEGELTSLNRQIEVAKVEAEDRAAATNDFGAAALGLTWTEMAKSGRASITALVDAKDSGKVYVIVGSNATGKHQVRVASAYDDQFSIYNSDYTSLGKAKAAAVELAKIIMEEEAKKASERASEPESFEHAGRLIYPTRIKLGDEVVDRWAVQTTENAARVAAGERPLGGDALATTADAAKAIAEEMNKQDAEAAKRAEELAAAEAEAAKRAAEAEAASMAGIAEFVAGIADPKMKARAIQTLNKMMRRSDRTGLLKDMVRDMVRDGYKLSSDSTYGPILKGPDGGFVEQKRLTKTGLDFAAFLIAQRELVEEDAESNPGADRDAEPGKTIGAIADALMLLGWKITPVRQGYAAESARGTEVVIEPDESVDTPLISIKGSSAHAAPGDDGMKVAEEIDMEDYKDGIDRFHDGDRIEDEDDPLNGQSLAFVRAVERVEAAAVRAGAQVAWGNFEASLTTGDMFDAVSAAAEAVRAGIVSGQIGKDGVILARVAIDEAGAITVYSGASGADVAGVETTVLGVASTIELLAASKPAPQPEPEVTNAEPAEQTWHSKYLVQSWNDRWRVTAHNFNPLSPSYPTKEEAEAAAAAYFAGASDFPAPSDAAAQIAPVAPAVKGDISYRAVDDMFTSFYPDSEAGEGAWNVINATEGSEGGKVLTQHAASVIEQLRAAGYTVTEAAPITESEDDLLAALNEPAADPELAADKAYLESLLDGSTDLIDPAVFERLEPMFAKYENDADMMGLLVKAANAYGDAAVAAAQTALAG